MESPVPFIAADDERSDDVWLLITETRLVASEGGGLVLTVTVPPAPATAGGGSLPTGFRLQQNTELTSCDIRVPTSWRIDMRFISTVDDPWKIITGHHYPCNSVISVM